MVAGIVTAAPIFAGPPVPPALDSPQVTTEPSVFSAAKAEAVEYTFVTPELRLDATAVESPPLAARPQVTTEPSAFSAAKAS